MGKIRARADNEKLFFDFTYLDQRCREQTTLPDTPANRKKLQKILERIEAEITLGSFDYATYFPQSSKVLEISRLQAGCASLKTPLFRDFAELWFEEMRVEWRETHAKTVRLTLDKHLLPEFGKKEVSAITKAELLSFRSALGKVPGQKGQSLTATRINHIMTPLRMILSEAADRFEFTSPYLNIKSLKVPKTDVEPFTLDEVLQILSTVREDFRNYYTVRFFTGVRTAEVDGLQWKYVDFQRRQILIRETWVGGKLDYTKNDGSQREIDMSEPVYQALIGQREKTGSGQFVFCTREGTPHAYRNINDRVWYPLLRHLGLRRRLPSANCWCPWWGHSAPVSLHCSMPLWAAVSCPWISSRKRLFQPSCATTPMSVLRRFLPMGVPSNMASTSCQPCRPERNSSSSCACTSIARP